MSQQTHLSALVGAACILLACSAPGWGQQELIVNGAYSEGTDGLTGWAQIRYSYGASVDDARRKLQFDLYYVKNNSLFLDLIILIETVSVVLFREGQ